MAEPSPGPIIPGPIIIVKRKITGHGHHGGVWKVAYADFVTAMMALFIVLWLLGSDEKTRMAVGGYFNDPAGKGKDIGSGLAGVGESLAVSKDDLNKLKQKIEHAVRSMPELKKLSEQLKLTITGEGLRIELLESEKGTFFESGSAKPSEVCLAMLHVLAAQLGKLPNKLVIEGHTDSRPFGSSNGYTNWELSADRANSARRVMLASGIYEEQVTQVRGFADMQPFKKENSEHPSNRRVTIIVKYGESAAKLSAEEAKAAH